MSVFMKDSTQLSVSLMRAASVCDIVHSLPPELQFQFGSADGGVTFPGWFLSLVKHIVHLYSSQPLVLL